MKADTILYSGDLDEDTIKNRVVALMIDERTNRSLLKWELVSEKNP